MVSAIDLLSPASSWNWLANLTRAARLASSRTILSWSFSVIEGNTSCRDDKRGDPRLSHFWRTSRRFFWTYQSALDDGCPTHIKGHMACDKVACHGPAAGNEKEPAGGCRGLFQDQIPGLAGHPEHGLHPHREAHVALDLELAAHEGRRRIELAREDLHEVARVGEHGEVGALDLALAGGRLAVRDLDEVLAGLLAAEIELDARAGVAGLLG